MAIFLKTKRLILKSPEMKDLNYLYALQSDPLVMKYIGKGVRTKAEVEQGLKKAIAHQKKYGFSLGCVYEKETGHFIGRAGLIYLAYDDTQPNIEVGYALMPAAWRQGYATELTHALLKWGFSHLAVPKLVAVINPKNESSRRVLEKAHMRYVGLAFYWDAEVALYEIFKLSLEYDKIALIDATLADYPTIQNMARFYTYDISEYFGENPTWEMPATGLYECFDFKKYWTNGDSFPMLIRYKNEIAGFAIVDKKGSVPSVDFNMAQFFILRKFKNKGLGKYVAHQCFKKFPGIWEVMVMPGNEGAYRFWRATIQAFVKNHFVEYTKTVAHLGDSPKNLFTFSSKSTENNV